MHDRRINSRRRGPIHVSVKGHTKGVSLKGVRVYDIPWSHAEAPYEVADRYTVVLPDGGVIGMSDNPLSPGGFNQYMGEWTVDGRPGFPYIKQKGKRVPVAALPRDVREAIKQRILQK